MARVYYFHAALICLHPIDSSIIISCCHAPEVSAPTPEHQGCKGHKKGPRDDPVPPPILAVEFVLPLYNEIALSYPLLPSPLQASEVDRPPRDQNKTERDDDAAHGQDHVDNHHVVVRIVVAVLNRAGDDADNDVHSTQASASTHHPADKALDPYALFIPILIP